MANFIYDKAREKFLSGELSWKNDTSGVIKVALVNNRYVPDQSQDITLNDINTLGQAIIADASLQNLTVTNGIAGADPITIQNVDSGNSIKYIVLYKHNNSNNQTTLIAFIDTAQGIDNGLTTDGRDIKIVWSNTSNLEFPSYKIFKL
jgi:hypothetical protein